MGPCIAGQDGTLYCSAGWNPVLQGRMETCIAGQDETLYCRAGWNPVLQGRMEPCIAGQDETLLEEKDNILVCIPLESQKLPVEKMKEHCWGLTETGK